MERCLWTLVACGFSLALNGLATAQTDAPLPSWNDDKAKHSVIAFVAQTTRAGSPDFVPPAGRIAVLDNDGTLWAEQPTYVPLAFAFDYLRENGFNASVISDGPSMRRPARLSPCRRIARLVESRHDRALPRRWGSRFRQKRSSCCTIAHPKQQGCCQVSMFSSTKIILPGRSCICCGSRQSENSGTDIESWRTIRDDIFGVEAPVAGIPQGGRTAIDPSPRLHAWNLLNSANGEACCSCGS